MTRPADIPQDIWDVGVDVLNDWSKGPPTSETIARAILAERERCATEAILVGCRVELRMAVDAPLGKAALARLHLIQETCETAAKAIRKGSA